MSLYCLWPNKALDVVIDPFVSSKVVLIIYPNCGSCLATVQEGLSRKERLALKVAEAAQQEAIQKLSLQRAKAEAAALEGASWGMMEDAEEDEEEEVYPNNNLPSNMHMSTDGDKDSTFC